MAFSCGYVAQDLLSPRGSSRRCVRHWVRGKMFFFVYTQWRNFQCVKEPAKFWWERISSLSNCLTNYCRWAFLFWNSRCSWLWNKLSQWQGWQGAEACSLHEIEVLTSSESDGNSIPAMITAACPYASHGKVGTVACSYDMAIPCRWDPHPRHLILPLPYRTAPYYTHSYRHHQVPSYA